MSIFLFTVEQKPNRILNKKAIFCEQRTKKDVPMMSYRHSYNVQKDDSSQPTKVLFISKTLKVKKIKFIRKPLYHQCKNHSANPFKELPILFGFS